MQAEHYRTRRDEIAGWPVNITTYSLGDRAYCIIDNVDPGARFARSEAASIEEAEQQAIEKAKKYLSQTRRFPSA